MAGHSKWANIQHRKGRQDAKRGKLWTKIIREITVAARAGGPDPEANPRLRMAWDKAMGANMPKDNIQRAITRGAGGADGANYDEIRYEGYGVSGAAVVVECMTDNRTRTVADVRHAFSKNGGNLGQEGSVAFMFTHCGQFIFAPGTSEDTIMEVALDAGADDVHQVVEALDIRIVGLVAEAGPGEEDPWPFLRQQVGDGLPEAGGAAGAGEEEEGAGGHSESSGWAGGIIALGA